MYIISLYLDFWILSGVSLLITLCVILFTKRHRTDALIYSTRVIFTVIFILTVSFLFYHHYYQKERNTIKQSLIEYAYTFASTFELLGHAKLNASTKATDETYLKLINLELRWKEVLHYDMYTLKKDNKGNNVLIVDSESDYNHDGKYDSPLEERTPIGTIYDEKIPELERAFQGYEDFTNKPYTDYWGTWVSVFVPMTENGKVNAVMGIDFPAADWITRPEKAANIILYWDGIILTAYWFILIAIYFFNRGLRVYRRFF